MVFFPLPNCTGRGASAAANVSALVVSMGQSKYSLVLSGNLMSLGLPDDSKAQATILSHKPHIHYRD